MSKKKMRTLFWAVAAVLAFVPFLHGCASAADDAGASGEAAEAEIAHNVESGDREYAAVRYGEVKSVDGTDVTVVLGTAGTSASNGSGDEGEGQARVPDVEGFVAGTDELSFDASLVELSDAGKTAIEAADLAPGDVLVMYGTGDGSDFEPKKVQVAAAAAAGTAADDARVPENVL